MFISSDRDLCCTAQRRVSAGATSANDTLLTAPARGAGKLGRSELGPGKLGSGIVGRWFRAEAVNSVETLSDPQTFAAYIGLLFGPNCN